MGRRGASVEETRRRIVEATMALHAERGIFGTSWRDIAERADVSVATVYKHFPSLAELVPACGDLVARISVPPTAGDVEPTFRDAPHLPERLSRLIAVFLDFYERGEPYLEVDARERQLAEVREWEAHMRDLREQFVREALRPLGPGEPTVRVVAALLDFPVYRSFRRQEVTRDSVAEALHGMLLCWLAGTRSGDGGR
jgi:AcrR family transcriptional regulator